MVPCTSSPCTASSTGVLAYAKMRKANPTDKQAIGRPVAGDGISARAKLQDNNIALLPSNTPSNT